MRPGPPVKPFLVKLPSIFFGPAGPPGPSKWSNFVRRSGPPLVKTVEFFCRLRRALPVRPQRFFHLRAHTLGQPYIRSLRWLGATSVALSRSPAIIRHRPWSCRCYRSQIIIPMIAHRFFGCGSDNLGVETRATVKSTAETVELQL